MFENHLLVSVISYINKIDQSSKKETDMVSLSRRQASMKASSHTYAKAAAKARSEHHEHCGYGRLQQANATVNAAGGRHGHGVAVRCALRSCCICGPADSEYLLR